MNTNKILSADLLDLVFDDRNKEYGAYDLRKSYNKRIGKALLITTALTVIVFVGSALGNSFEPPPERVRIIPGLELTEIKEPEIPIPPPEPELPEPEPV